MMPPNILLLCSDQQRYDAVGYGPGSWIDTPSLERLAAGGTVFTRAFCNNPI